MRSPFHGRTIEQSLATSTALLVLVLTGASMAFVGSRVKASMRRGLEARGAALAKSIGAVATPSLLAYNYAALQMAAEGPAGNEGVVYVAIHDKEGVLAGVAGRAPEAAPLQLAGALHTRDVFVPRTSGKGQRERVIEVSIPVQVDGVDAAWGRVRVGLSYDIVAAEIRTLGLQVLLLGALLAVAAVLGMGWLARLITAPLRHLGAGTEALAAGDLQHRIPIPVSGAKELSDLARAFNTMSDKLQEKAGESRRLQDALEALNSTLEEQVQERTRALEESQARLSETEKLRALGELASGVAHDFNNLLGAILGRAQLLRKQGMPPDVDADLAVVEKAAQDGRETVRRIQEFSRTRRDKRFEPLDLAEILSDALQITRTRWKDDALLRKVQIHPVLDTKQAAPILGNASELREVFTNLILNAVDAMPQGGRLELSCFVDGERAFAKVMDTGVGMTEKIRQNIFDPFFTTKGPRGMGLGMSVVYGIVTRHGGKIDIDTALGRGTTFTLEFPVTHEQRVNVAGGDGAALPQLIRPGRILVVDDEPDVAAVVKDVLMTAGHEVDTALSGLDALKMVELTAYDIVFTDLGMPDISGWEVAERIGSKKPAPAVVLVTGWGTSLDEADATRRGVASIVQKPFEIDEILKVAGSLLK